MKTTVSTALLLGLLVAGGTAVLLARQQAAAPISWDNWRAAQQNAKAADDGGKLKEAYEAYLEYIRQADGLHRPDLVAWGKNNAAFMLIKVHKQDRTTDLAPARKLLEDVMASPDATEDCKRAAEKNMAYVASVLGGK